MALTDIQQLVTDLVRDDANKISNAQRDQAVAIAVERYSKDRPRDYVEDVTAPGGNLLPLPAGWQADFSQLQSIEQPVGNVPPSMVPNTAWSLYNAPGGLSVMLSIAIGVNATARLTYTIRHQVDGTHDTIPLGDREAVCCLAAASLCDQLASLYSGDTDSTIQADSVNHASKSSEFAKRATALRKRYHDELGIDLKKNVAAGVVVSLEAASSLGTDRMTHGKTYRGSRRRVY